MALHYWHLSLQSRQLWRQSTSRNFTTSFRKLIKQLQMRWMKRVCTTLSCSTHWTSHPGHHCSFRPLQKKQKTVERLKTAHSRLQQLLVEDEQDAVRSALLAQKVEVVLKLANDDALSTETTRAITDPKTNPGNDAHPLLAKMKISTTDLNALEDFSEVIQSSLVEKHINTMVASKGPLVPIKPSRSVELLVADFQHRMWAVGNTNLLAPISIPMWKAWVGLSKNEVESYKKQAMNKINYGSLYCISMYLSKPGT
jgi:hypothetical protein